ncbi:MAG TPA: hypothetical protein VK469_18540 [Candidatus Kapabacteria bacterium]|nr:hypothetical protein [Candidatus Kapabacteria bacterium]
MEVALRKSDLFTYAHYVTWPDEERIQKAVKGRRIGSSRFFPWALPGKTG